MNELKDLCDRMVADAPPMREGAAVLAAARRSVARRRLFATAAVVVAAAAGVAVPVAIYGGRTQPGETAAAEPADPAAHSKRMADVLVAAAPAGLLHSVVKTERDPAGPVASSPGVVVSWADASVLLIEGDSQGILTASVYRADAPDESCRAGATCVTETVNGVPVAVTSGVAEAGMRITALRRFDGGYVWVGVSQALLRYEAGGPVVGPKLTTFPFTARQVAELAADPRMLPPA